MIKVGLMLKQKTLTSPPDLPKLEEKVLEFWRKNQSFLKQVELKPAKKRYVFYDGPPFATGMPHYGHLLGSTSKDVVPRYWAMKGFRVERIWGWDCHGLPIENMIEKQLNIQGGKKGIEKMGIAAFNEACRKEVLRLDKEWEKIIERLGRWVDFANSYKTMDKDYMESVWWGFAQLYKKGLIYQGKKVILYCPRCATPLSNFEIAMDNSYQTINDSSTIYKYPIKGQDQTYILAWSTTPWNKLATPALAVNADLAYVLVKQDGESYILAENTLKILNDKPYEVVKKYSGKELTKLEFEPHYDFYPNRSKNEVIGAIVADPFVTDEEGTGVVTLAIYGEDDLRVMQKHNIQLVEHVDEEGKLKEEVKPWAGLDILEANPLVNKDLSKRGLIYKEQPHEHSVPACYRCDTRLYYAPVPAWFINIKKLRDRLLIHNQNINWFPDHLKHGRFQKGIETAPDWNISRSRYWGTPMPIWRDEKTGQYRIIESVEELQKWAVDSKQVEGLDDLHRDHLDHIKVWVDDKKTIQGSRIPEVFDCWVESGAMPFAQLHYPFEKKREFESSYPAQFVSEYIAQTRAWFYCMHVVSVGIFDKHPVENILTTGTILAADGSKMSKSKNNYPDPMKLIDRYGVDSLRLYLMSSTVMRAENLNFNAKAVSDIRKNVFVIWYNLYSFYALQAGDSNVDLKTTPGATNILDRWLLSRLHSTIAQVSQYMDDYDLVRASRFLIDFVGDVSTWYLRRSRDRLRDANQNQEALAVFGYVLLTMAQLFAPFAPFFSEWLYHQLANPTKNSKLPESVHHTDWPEANNKLIKPQLEEDMAVVRTVVEKIHAARSQAGVKVRQPLASVSVHTQAKKPSQDLLEVLMEEVNIKAVDWKQAKSVQKESVVELDTELTSDLKAEGEARELMRQIQKLRKKAGLTFDQKARATAPDWPSDWQQEIETKTNTTLTKGAKLALT